jgi:hypothetical protein
MGINQTKGPQTVVSRALGSIRLTPRKLQTTILDPPNPGLGVREWQALHRSLMLHSRSRSRAT